MKTHGILVITGWVLFLLGFLSDIFGITKFDIMSITVYSGILGVVTGTFISKSNNRNRSTGNV